MPFPPPPPPPRRGPFVPPPPPPPAGGQPVGPLWPAPPPPQQQPPPPPPPAPYGYGYVPRGTNGLAIAALILGAVWIGGLGSLLAVILGHAALSQIRRSGEDGRGVAITGLVLGYVGVAMSVALVALVVTAFHEELDDQSFPFPQEIGITTTSRAAVTANTVARTAPVYGTTECPPTVGATDTRSSFSAPFRQCIDVTKKYTATMSTNKGELTILLDPVQAPLTVNNFVALARYRYYDATRCHRIIPAFVVQCGDPTAIGTGGPGYKFADELPRAGQYKIGSVAMANSGPNTNGSQFFIVTGANGVALPPNYTLFGEVIGGASTTLMAMDAAGSASGSTTQLISITSVRITES